IGDDDAVDDARERGGEQAAALAKRGGHPCNRAADDHKRGEAHDDVPGDAGEGRIRPQKEVEDGDGRARGGGPSPGAAVIPGADPNRGNKQDEVIRIEDRLTEQSEQQCSRRESDRENAAVKGRALELVHRGPVTWYYAPPRTPGVVTYSGREPGGRV